MNGFPVNWELISGALLVVLLLILIAELERRHSKKQVPSDEEYLYMMTRKRECSTFDIFKYSAGDWKIPRDRMERDFNIYLQRQSMPFYVVDYIRRHKQELSDRS